SLYEILKFMYDVLLTHSHLRELGVEHMLVPSGLVLNQEGHVVVSDLRLLQFGGSPQPNVGEESAPLNRIGQLVGEALRRHTSTFDLNTSVIQSDHNEYPHSLPTKLIDLLRKITSTPARIDVAKAISAVEKFLGFRDNPVPLSEDSSITINGEF